MASIPLLDLKLQFQGMREEILAAVTEVLESQRLILGPRVAELETQIASLTGVRHAVGCASGSDAILLALAACGVTGGAKVVTSPFSFFASAGSIAHAGGRPLFCDIEPDTFNMDPRLLAAALSSEVRAALPVHLFGQCADMDPILAACGARGIPVVEDAAQAIGATYRGSNGGGPERRAGSMGRAGCISFFPSKNLGGAGDGGMVTTGDDELAARLRLLRVHGGRKMYHHEQIGWNSRLDELQAAVLLVKLGRLATWSEARAQRAGFYDRLFNESGLPSRGLVTPPVIKPGRGHIFHQYTIRAQRRDSLREHLESAGIATGVYYPVPLHLQECFRPLGYAKGDFPQSERACEEVLSLPVYPELTEQAQRTVVGAISSFYGLATQRA